jgi:hypothetical protein
MLVLIALCAATCWYWFAWQPYPRFKAENLQIVSMVSTGRSGAPSLTVGFRNLGERSILTLRSPELRGPFRVELLDTRTGKEIPRLPKSLIGPAGKAFTVAKQGETRWSVSFEKLYGKVPPGKYRLKVYYDTRAARGRGEKWVEGIDIGKSESKPVVFEIEGKSEAEGD